MISGWIECLHIYSNLAPAVEEPKALHSKFNVQCSMFNVQCSMNILMPYMFEKPKASQMPAHEA